MDNINDNIITALIILFIDQVDLTQCVVSCVFSGEPIADAFAVCARRNSALLIVADGVNWGEKSMLAARCAVYGCVQFINQQLFSAPNPITTTHVSLCDTVTHVTLSRHSHGCRWYRSLLLLFSKVAICTYNFMMACGLGKDLV